jgi:hypothetical protein
LGEAWVTPLAWQYRDAAQQGVGSVPWDQCWYVVCWHGRCGNGGSQQRSAMWSSVSVVVHGWSRLLLYPTLLIVVLALRTAPALGMATGAPVVTRTGMVAVGVGADPGCAIAG